MSTAPFKKYWVVKPKGDHGGYLVVARRMGGTKTVATYSTIESAEADAEAYNNGTKKETRRS